MDANRKFLHPDIPKDVPHSAPEIEPMTLEQGSVRVVNRVTLRQRWEDAKFWLRACFLLVIVVLVVLGGVMIYHFARPLFAVTETAAEDFTKVNKALIYGIHSVAQEIADFAKEHNVDVTRTKEDLDELADNTLKLADSYTHIAAKVTGNAADLTGALGKNVEDAGDWAVRQMKFGLWALDCMFVKQKDCYRNYFDKFKLCGKKWTNPKDCTGLSHLFRNQ